MSTKGILSRWGLYFVTVVLTASIFIPDPRVTTDTLLICLCICAAGIAICETLLDCRSIPDTNKDRSDG